MTKRLIKVLNKVPEKYIIELAMNTNHVIQLNENETFNVNLIHANHCLGAVMFLFEGYFGRILSTGN